MSIIFSHSSNNDTAIAYHGTNRGFSAITFYGPKPAIVSDLLKVQQHSDTSSDITRSVQSCTAVQSDILHVHVLCCDDVV